MSYTVCPANGRSPAIVSLSATPPVRKTSGQGGASMPMVIQGSALAPVNMPTTDYLPIVRIPLNSIIHKVEICLDTAPSTSLTGSIGLIFSDAGNTGSGVPGAGDGTPSYYQSVNSLTSATPDIISQSCFFYAAAIQSYVGLWTDVTFQNYTGNSVTDGFYVPSASSQPIWQALNAGSTAPGGTSGLGKATAATSGMNGSAYNLTYDVGGFCDVTWFETTTGVNTSAVTINLRVTFSNAAS